MGNGNFTFCDIVTRIFSLELKKEGNFFLMMAPHCYNFLQVTVISFSDHVFSFGQQETILKHSVSLESRGVKG